MYFILILMCILAVGTQVSSAVHSNVSRDVTNTTSFTRLNATSSPKRTSRTTTTTSSLQDLYDDEIDAVDQPDFVNPVECRELVVVLRKQNRTHQEFCGAVLATDGCQSGDSFINYVNFLYCSLPGLQWYWMVLGGLLYTVWIAIMFVVVGVVADAFFCSSLEVLSEMLHMSQSIAGVTFLALGTGAPDVFSSIAAVNSAETAQPTLALGSLLGGGLLAITVIAGTLFSCTPFELARRPFMRDLLFYTGTVGGLLALLWKGSVTQLEGIGFLILYVAYASLVIFGRVVYVKWVHRKKGPDAAAQEEIDHNEERQVVSEILRPPMRLSFCRTGSVRSLQSQTSGNRRTSTFSEKLAKRLRDMELLEIPPTAASSMQYRTSLDNARQQPVDCEKLSGKNAETPSTRNANSRGPSMSYGDLPARRHPQTSHSKSLVHSNSLDVRGGNFSSSSVVRNDPRPIDSGGRTVSHENECESTFNSGAKRTVPITAKKLNVIRRWLSKESPVVEKNESASAPTSADQERQEIGLELPDIIKSIDISSPEANRRVKFVTNETPRSSNSLQPAPKVLAAGESSAGPSDYYRRRLSSTRAQNDDATCSDRRESTKSALKRVDDRHTPTNVPSIQITMAPSFGFKNNVDSLASQGAHNSAFVDDDGKGRRLEEAAATGFLTRKLTTQEKLYYYGSSFNTSRISTDADGGGESASNTSTVLATGLEADSATDNDEHHDLLPWYIDVFEHIWPVTLEQWRATPCVLRAFSVLKVPIQVILFCIIPLVDTNEPSGLRNWCKWLQVWHLAFSPGFCVFLFTSWNDKTFFGVPLYVPVFGVSCALAAVVAILTRRNVAPRGHSLYAVLGFICAVAVIYKVANEIVGVLTALGVMFRLSQAMLGLTLLAWGNSVPELISSYALARHGFQRVAVSSCYAGPMFAALVGTGLAYTIGAGRMEGKVITFSAGPVSILLAFYVLGVCCLSLVAIPLQGFRPKRWFGFVLLGLYALFIPIIILAELKVY